MPALTGNTARTRLARMKEPRVVLTLTFLFTLGGALALSQGKGGGDETGPYDVVRGWPENYCGTGHVIGATAGILAERPDRVFIFSRGCLPVIEDTRGPAENFIPLRNAANYDLSQADASRHPRWPRARRGRKGEGRHRRPFGHRRTGVHL